MAQLRYLMVLVAFWSGRCMAQLPVFVVFNENKVTIGKNQFLDDFNGNRINDSLWFEYYPWGGLSIDAQTYTDPKMCQQKAGELYLTVDTTSVWRTFPAWMVDSTKLKASKQILKDGKLEIKRLTSALWSKQKVKYGFFECRCWLPKGRGLWPAFWLYGGEPNEEIDFMEAKGERKKSYHVDVHCPERCDRIKKFGLIDKPFGHWTKTKSSLLGEWVVFSGLWTPNGVLFYFNNELKAAHAASFKTNMNVIANMSMAMDNGPFSPGPNDKTPFPSQFKIDYIRAWNLPEPCLNIDLAEWKEASFITCVNLGEDQMVFEFLGEFKKSDRVFIEFQENPIIELDLTQKKQFIDAHFWKKGEYTLRAIRGLSTSQTVIIQKD